MKYWLTVRTTRHKPGSGIEWTCTHTLRYGRQVLAWYAVTDLAPFGDYYWYHKRPEGLFQVDLSIKADKSTINRVVNIEEPKESKEESHE